MCVAQKNLSLNGNYFQGITFDYMFGIGINGVLKNTMSCKGLYKNVDCMVSLSCGYEWERIFILAAKGPQMGWKYIGQK